SKVEASHRYLLLLAVLYPPRGLLPTAVRARAAVRAWSVVSAVRLVLR
ncbi:hypothetical protein H7H80_30250, partial [Mycobacterium interjectum]|nr:hypothetical protein [Mycobacterium interjectum]